MKTLSEAKDQIITNQELIIEGLKSDKYEQLQVSTVLLQENTKLKERVKELSTLWELERSHKENDSLF